MKNISIVRNRIINISLIILCQSFQVITIGGIALFLPIIRDDLGISFTQGGTLASAGTLTYAIMQIPAGYLADRYGGRRVFIVGILGVTILSITFGFVTEYWQAIANQGLSGFFRAFLFAPGLSLIAGWFPAKKRAMAMGLYLLGGFIGNLIIDIAGPLLVSRFDWRFPFLAFPPFGILSALVLWRIGKDPPVTNQGRTINIGEVLAFFRQKLMWVSGSIQYIRLAVMTGTTFWLPSLLIEEKGISLQVTGLLIALRALLTAPSNILGGYVSDRLKNPILVISVSLVILAITTALLVIVNNFLLLIIVLVINSMFVQMYFGPLFSIPVEILGDRTRGSATGFSNFFANIGAFITVYLLGVLKDSSGSFYSGFIFVAISCSMGLILTAFLARMRRYALDLLEYY
ncbi:MFS transporter [Chloroflexota bacterium]